MAASIKKSVQEVNDELIVGIADLRRQISDLKASNASLQYEIASLQSTHRQDIADICSLISDLKASHTSLESRLLSSQSAPYKDIADLWDQITILNSNNIMLESQLASLQSDHCYKIAEIGSQISGLNAFDAIVNTHILSSQSSYNHLADHVNYTETNLLQIQNNFSQMLTVGAGLKEEMRQGKMGFMALIRKLEDRVSELFMKKNAMSQQMVKYEGDSALQHTLLASSEVERGREKVKANLAETIFTQLERENHSQKVEIVGLREEMKRSKNFTFWAVLSSAFVAVGSLAYLICKS